MTRLKSMAASLFAVLLLTGCGNSGGTTSSAASNVRSSSSGAAVGSVSGPTAFCVSRPVREAVGRPAVVSGMTAFAAACAGVQSDDPAERARALNRLVAACEDIDEPDETVSRQILVIMTVGLKDDDPAVRAAAFDALLRLPLPERKALCLQALGNDDPEIKLALLELTGNPQEEFELTFNFQALDAEEPEVRKAASDNLRRLIGMSFASAEEAFAWWETVPDADTLFSNKERNDET